MNEIILILLITGGIYILYSLKNKVIFQPAVTTEALSEMEYPQNRTIIYSTPKLSAPERPACLLFSEYENNQINISYHETNSCAVKMYHYAYHDKKYSSKQYDTSFLSDQQYQHVAEEFSIC